MSNAYVGVETYAHLVLGLTPKWSMLGVVSKVEPGSVCLEAIARWKNQRWTIEIRL